METPWGDRIIEAGGAPTHAELARGIGCTLYEPEGIEMTRGEMMDCRFSDRRDEIGDYAERVHIRVFDSNDDRDADLEMIREVCGGLGFDTDDVTVFVGDGWAINAVMTPEMVEAVEDGTGAEPQTVKC